HDWHMLSQSTFSEDILKVLKTSECIDRQYINSEGNKVHFYIGYHGGGKDSGEIHSPKHCLPGSGWFKVMEKEVLINVSGKQINLVKAIYQKGTAKELFLYWYQIKGKTLSDEYSLKIAEIVNSIFYRRKDSALIRISVPFDEEEEKAFYVGSNFLKDFYPIIKGFLPE
ncbi:MAG: exosortase C-terminal domain/associated protein EpsI, partial [Nitrospirota bacterium]